MRVSLFISIVSLSPIYPCTPARPGSGRRRIAVPALRPPPGHPRAPAGVAVHFHRWPPAAPPPCARRPRSPLYATAHSPERSPTASPRWLAGCCSPHAPAGWLATRSPRHRQLARLPGSLEPARSIVRPRSSSPEFAPSAGQSVTLRPLPADPTGSSPPCLSAPLRSRPRGPHRSRGPRPRSCSLTSCCTCTIAWPVASSRFQWCKQPHHANHIHVRTQGAARAASQHAASQPTRAASRSQRTNVGTERGSAAENKKFLTTRTTN